MLRSTEWRAHILELSRNDRPRSEDPTLLRRLAKDVREALQANHAGSAVRSAFAGVALSGRKLYLISDSLRPFTYDTVRFRKVQWAVGELERHVADCDELRRYLPAIASWIAFSNLVAIARTTEAHLESRIARMPMQTLHGVLSVLDEDFHSQRRAHLATLAPTGYGELEAEQAASGASHLVQLLARMGKLSRANRESLRESHRLTREEARDIILTSYWLRELREHEVLVFRLGFTCMAEASNTFRIEAPSDDVGYALSYGWFQANFLPALRIAGDVYESVGIKTLADAFVAATEDDRPYVLKTDGQRPHFGYRIREGHALAVASVVNRTGAFREEELELRIASDQLKVTTSALLALELTSGLPVRDVVRFQRFLGFLALTRSVEIDRSKLPDDDKRASRLLFLNRETFLQMAATCGLEHATAESLVATFSWSPGGNSRLDLQHTPLVVLHDHVLVPLSVAAGSNLIRNGLWSSGVRPYADGTTDPLVADLRLAFEMAKLRCWGDVKYEWAGKTYEIDSLALVGKHLVLFEAKNTLHPCSYFELRTTWDCLEKAGEQLDRHLHALSDATVRARLSKRLGVEIGDLSLETCIVVSHPLFSGIRLFGHAVRQCDVVCNFVAAGTATAWIGKRRIVMRLRPEGTLQERDLLEFLGDDNPTYRDAWASGMKRIRPATLGKARLHIVEYTFIPAVQLARSGLCEGVHQRRLETAIARVNQLSGDAPRDAVEAAWAEMRAAHGAAVESLQATGEH